MNDSEQNLMRVAEAVADDAPVDWQEEFRINKDLQGRLRKLRLVDSVARTYRRLALVTPDESAAPTRDFKQETDPAPQRTPIDHWGSLELRQKIGRGSFGQVYRAYDPSLQIEVALKLLFAGPDDDPTGEARFLHEARKLARVRHPNVLVVHGADRRNGRVGLWTDLLEGKTLEDCLKDDGPFGAHEATVIGVDLCHALAAVHGAGLVHRDVKTTNVMRERGGRIVLLDFSAAINPGEHRSAAGRLSLSGTPMCMAPELFQGADASVASDVYAVGVLLYRLVSSRFPVEASTLAELQQKHRRGDSVPLLDVRSDLPEAFVQVVQKALAPDPRERYASVGELERALTASLATPGPDQHPAAVPWWRRREAGWAAAAALVVAVVLGATFIPGLWLFEVDASMFRLRDEIEERLMPGGRISPGDLLFLEIEGTRPMYVYVLNEDTNGEAFVLFPLRDSELQNPLPKDTLHRLPGKVAGVTKHWKVTSAGGEETFFVIASKRPIEKVEQEVADLPRAGSATAPTVDAETIESIRGVGGLGEPHRPEGGAQGERLSELFSDVAEPSAAKRGVWVWQIRLSNPG